MTYEINTRIEWNGLAYGVGSPFVIDDPGITGWEESTPIEKLSDSRMDSYGDRDTPVRGKGRTVVVAGHCSSRSDRDSLVAAFRVAGTLPADPAAKGELTITTAGQTLMAYAQVTGRRIVQGPYWGIGRFGWAMQWQCDDLVRYGPEVTATAPLDVTDLGGITPPFTPPIVLDPVPKSGVISVFNPGERLTPVVFELRGPQTGLIGVENMTTQKRLTYAAPLAGTHGDTPADVLTIDTRQGLALLNGDAFRSALPGSAVTRTVGLVPGVNEIRATGKAPGGGNARLLVRFRPASE